MTTMRKRIAALLPLRGSKRPGLWRGLALSWLVFLPGTQLKAQDDEYAGTFANSAPGCNASSLFGIEDDDSYSIGANDDLSPCWYVGGGWGISRVRPEGEDNGWSQDDDRSSGFNAYVGRQITDRFFLELSYADLGSAELDNSSPTVTDTVSLDYQVPALMVGYSTGLLHPSLNVYGKVGISSIQNSIDDSSVNYDKETDAQLAGAIGMQWRFSPRFFSRLEFATYDRDAKYLGLSVGMLLGSQQASAEPAAPPPEPEPIPEPEPVCTRYMDDIGPLYFDSDKSELRPDAREHLKEIVAILEKDVALHLEIHGHADSTATNAYNMALSERRAQSVMNFLLEQQIDSRRLSTKWFGEEEPVADNKTKEGRQLNRRAEFIKLYLTNDGACQQTAAVER